MDPTLLLVGGGLLALVLGHEIFSDDDDDDDNTKPLDIEAEDGVARGTADDDLITTENITGVYTAIHAGAGNDTVETEPYDARVDVYGDAGNDKLDIEFASEMTIDGGGGNDTIEADGGGNATILGGAGDDIIDYSDEDYGIDSTFAADVIDAGAGDDVVEAELSTHPFHMPLEVTTGAGADTISFTPEIDNIVLTYDDVQPGGVPTLDRTGELAQITDFDPKLDQLTIDPMSELDPESLWINDLPAEISYAGYEVTEDADGTVVSLIHDVVSAEESAQYTLNIDLPGATGIPASAIKIIGV